MNRFLEYVANHPWLSGAVVLLAVVAVVLEIRHRARSGGSISAQDAVRLANQGALLLDVRPREQYEAGHIIEARNVPGPELESSFEQLKKYREKPIVTYCDTGFTSASAARVLKANGFAKVVNLSGGLNAWRQENMPLVKDAGRSDGRARDARGSGKAARSGAKA